MIMNTNDEGKAFAVDELEEMLSTQMKVAIVTAYSNFITGIQSDPN